MMPKELSHFNDEKKIQERSNSKAMKPRYEQNNHYYRSLTRKMITIVIIVSFTPLVLISGTLLYYFHISYKEKVISQLEELVLKHKQNIDSFLVERLDDVKSLSRSYDLEKLRNEEFLHELLSGLKEAHRGAFVDLGVVNTHGVQIAYAGPFKLARAQYAEADWFKKATESEQFISDVFLGLRGLPHFIVAVRREWRGEKWILRSTVDFEAFNKLVEGIRIGKTGFAFILNKEAEFQTRERLEVVSSHAPYIAYLNSADMLLDRVSVVEKRNDFGKKCIYVMTSLKDGEWLLALQQDQADAFSDLYHARKLALMIFLLGGLGIVATTFVLSKRMVRRIERADREKEMMNEQVIEAGKLASLGELAAGIAHEINNPVAIMVEEAGWIEDLLEEKEFQSSENLEEFGRSLKQIRQQGARCKEITHKLLSFARKTDPKVQDVQLNELLEEVVGLSGQSARYSGVKIITNLAQDLPRVNVSPSEMQQIFLNLINNALDAMDKNGGQIEITSRAQDHYVVVDIADTGRGIPEANLARIFDPFFTTKPVGKGTGLGLSICYGIIKKMRGEISVNSAVGIGTTFHVRIPLSGEDRQQNMQGSIPSPGGRG